MASQGVGERIRRTKDFDKYSQLDLSQALLKLDHHIYTDIRNLEKNDRSVVTLLELQKLLNEYLRVGLTSKELLALCINNSSVIRKIGDGVILIDYEKFLKYLKLYRNEVRESQRYKNIKGSEKRSQQKRDLLDGLFRVNTLESRISINCLITAQEKLISGIESLHKSYEKYLYKLCASQGNGAMDYLQLQAYCLRHLSIKLTEEESYALICHVDIHQTKTISLSLFLRDVKLISLHRPCGLTRPPTQNDLMMGNNNAFTSNMGDGNISERASSYKDSISEIDQEVRTRAEESDVIMAVANDHTEECNLSSFPKRSLQTNPIENDSNKNLVDSDGDDEVEIRFGNVNVDQNSSPVKSNREMKTQSTNTADPMQTVDNIEIGINNFSTSQNPSFHSSRDLTAAPASLGPLRLFQLHKPYIHGNGQYIHQCTSSHPNILDRPSFFNHDAPLSL